VSIAEMVRSTFAKLRPVTVTEGPPEPGTLTATNDESTGESKVTIE
jgi:hypothetical protein